jgi:hypothetical protein
MCKEKMTRLFFFLQLKEFLQIRGVHRATDKDTPLLPGSTSFLDAEYAGHGGNAKSLASHFASKVCVYECVRVYLQLWPTCGSSHVLPHV